MGPILRQGFNLRHLSLIIGTFVRKKIVTLKIEKLLFCDFLNSCIHFEINNYDSKTTFVAIEAFKVTCINYCYLKF